MLMMLDKDVPFITFRNSTFSVHVLVKLDKCSYKLTLVVFTMEPFRAVY